MNSKLRYLAAMQKSPGYAGVDGRVIAYDVRHDARAISHSDIALEAFVAVRHHTGDRGKADWSVLPSWRRKDSRTIVGLA